MYADVIRFAGDRTSTTFGIEQLDLSNDLIGERSGHDKRWVSGSIAQVEEATFGKHNDGTLCSGAFVEDPFVYLRLDLNFFNAGYLCQTSHIDFIVKMPHIANHGFILHREHVISHAAVTTAGGWGRDIPRVDDVSQPCQPTTIRGGLQRNIALNFRDDAAWALTGTRICCTRTDIRIATHSGRLCANKHIGSAHYAIRQ